MENYSKTFIFSSSVTQPGWDDNKCADDFFSNTMGPWTTNKETDYKAAIIGLGAAACVQGMEELHV